MRVLIIEDEKEIAKFIIAGLREEGFALDWAQNGEKGLLLAKTHPYDCAVIDIRLSGKADGLEICRAIREKEQTFPIIMLSVTRDPQKKIAAFAAGADDYMTKPFLFAELLARIRAVLRRERKIITTELVMGDLRLDTVAHEAWYAEKSVYLNRKEFALLEYFMRNPGTLLTRNMILDHVWDSHTDELTNTVDVHIRFLRRKVDCGPQKLIHTVHGHGYKMEVQAVGRKRKPKKEK